MRYCLLVYYSRHSKTNLKDGIKSGQELKHELLLQETQTVSSHLQQLTYELI